MGAQTTLNLNLHPRNYQASSWSRSSVKKKKKIFEIPFNTKTPNNAIPPIQCLVNLQRAGHINILQTDRSSTKRPLSSCEEAIFSCCSDQWSTFLQSARCFELNNCPGINFIANPCFRLSAVINRI